MKPLSPPTTTTTGFSFSPGGLLLPYHMGVLEVLAHQGPLQSDSPLAGSSAGSIAVAAHACGMNGATVVDATVAISDECAALGGARGRLLPRLRHHLETMITDDHFAAFQARPGPVSIAYREVFPRNRSWHPTQFATKHDLINAVCYSSMFPFFSTNWPMTVCTANQMPRLVVDGFFAVPRDRFGCPDFALANVPVDRTVLVSCFPQDTIRLDACAPEDCIAPVTDRVGDLFRWATESSSRQELAHLYERGWEDAETWCRAEEERNKHNKHNDHDNTSKQHDDILGDGTTIVQALN